MFNVNYDKTLGLMLAGSKNKRDRIIEFLKEIPLELLNQICESLRNHYPGSKDGFSGEIITKGEIIYYYNMEGCSSFLHIGKGIYYMDERMCSFELILHPFDYGCYSNLKNDDDMILGSILYDFVHTMDKEGRTISFDLNNFTLIKLPLGNVIMAREYSDGVRRRYSVVNIKNVPDVLDINKFNQNRLVRSRRKW